MERTESLKDGKKILLRQLTLDDLEPLFGFFQSLPDDDRRYFRTNVADKEQLTRKVRRVENGEDVRVLALDCDRVVGHGSLELSTDDWKAHQAELRVFVARDYRRRGLGLVLMRELYLQAAKRKVESLVVKMMRPQKAARKICRRLGFHQEHVLPDYVRDQTGTPQDLVLMSCNLEELWQQLEELFQDMDRQRYQ